MSVTYNKLRKRLRRLVGKAIDDFQMIEEGDRIMVCLSGGKDSYTMLDILIDLQKSAPVNFSLTAVNLDQKQPDFPADVLPNYLKTLGIDFHILEADTYSIVKEKIPAGKTMCSLCSRLRRGNLYSFAKEQGFTKIALGHHKFDIIETFFLNLFNGGAIKAMPAKLKSDDGENIVIRPLAYCDERDIAKYAKWREFPIIPCNLCGSQENLQRQAIKQMLLEWEKIGNRRLESVFAALSNIAPSQMLDRNLFDFVNFELASTKLTNNGKFSGEEDIETDEIEIKKPQAKIFFP
ncbi:MAG: tRNA 2-thiocytidine(32) synthetase TtcA [Cardiobacteriaceae bacterium]|nr:tRNA 2-thiocytidine(32) synthetase TtcA [Cardiobacteriaceae bacterium]